MPARLCQFPPVFGKRIRATRLDECGNVPEPGTPCSYVATGGFITVSLSSEVEEGVEIFQRRADGVGVCVNEMGPSTFKRFTVEMEFCGVNPDLLDIVTNAETYDDHAGDPSGITISEGPVDGRFALELWTGLSGVQCEPGEESASGYLLLPYVNQGVLGDIEVDGENAVTFSLTGAFTKSGNQWGVGPFDVLQDGVNPAPLPTALDADDHLLLIDTGLAPPADECDCQPMPDES